MRSSTRVPDALGLPPGGEALGGRETVLVVGKTPALSSLMVEVLRRYGYQVMEASDALEALRLTQAYPAIELALIDLSSSEPGPFQMALWLRAMRPQIKVLVATDTLWDVGFEVGASQHIAFLAKPFTPFELARMVRRVLGGGFAE